jgi:Alcohol dehydrogenase GroES-like domain
MRAIVIEKFGGIDGLVYKDIPEPEPKAGHVVIQIKAFGINHAEMHMRRGEWAEAAEVSGIECVGIVKSCPGGEFPVGAKVAVEFLPFIDFCFAEKADSLSSKTDNLPVSIRDFPRGTFGHGIPLRDTIKLSTRASCEVVPLLQDGRTQSTRSTSAAIFGTSRTLKTALLHLRVQAAICGVERFSSISALRGLTQVKPCLRIRTARMSADISSAAITGKAAVSKENTTADRLKKIALTADSQYLGVTERHTNPPSSITKVAI